MSSARILLAEDDQNLGYILKEYLEMKEYQVTLARDGEEGLEYFQQSKKSCTIMPYLYHSSCLCNISEKNRVCVLHCLCFIQIILGNSS